jgi:hypothetical protein
VLRKVPRFEHREGVSGQFQGFGMNLFHLDAVGYFGLWSGGSSGMIMCLEGVFGSIRLLQCVENWLEGFPHLNGVRWFGASKIRGLPLSA